MTVFSPQNRPDISLAISGNTFRNGIVPHSLQLAGVVAHHGVMPVKFSPFRAAGSSVAHAMRNFARRAPLEGSGGLR